MIKRLLGALCIVLMLLVAGCGMNNSSDKDQAAASAQTKVVVDQLGRKVTIPAHVKRIVCLQHHSLDILLELQAGDKLVGVVKDWQGLVSPDLARIYPPLAKLPEPGDLKNANVEEISKLKPDVVIVSHYINKDVITKLEKMGIPVIAISLYKASAEEVSKVNPNLKDPDKAYTEGLIEGVKLLGQVADKEKKADDLVKVMMENRKLVHDTLAKAKGNEKPVTVYMANPNLYTYGTGKYVGTMYEKVGVKNVAEHVKGYGQVTMEQILAWNPDIIFVQSRYKNLVKDIETNPTWQPIKAVQDKKVIMAPEFVKPWGNPCPESVALGELWMAKNFHPEIFKDVDLKAKVDSFYKEFYGVPYEGTY